METKAIVAVNKSEEKFVDKCAIEAMSAMIKTIPQYTPKRNNGRAPNFEDIASSAYYLARLMLELKRRHNSQCIE